MGVCCGSTDDAARKGAIPVGKIASKITFRARPFDNMTDDEEKKQWAMKEYMELNKPDENGIDFVGKTSYMIAYERMLESEKPEKERLFNDPLAKYFTGGEWGKRVSDMLAMSLT